MSASANPVISADLDEIVARALPWERLFGASVLVTGASGMLPSYTVLTLLTLNDRHDAGITVYGLVRNGEKARTVLADIIDRSDFHLVVQDVSEPLTLDAPIDYVVHGASAARPSSHAADPVGTIRANLTGTFNMLDLCVRKQTRGFVFMSSAEVYGAQPEGTELISENSYGGIDVLNPRACYSEGKRAAETISVAYAAQYGLTCRIVRFGHIYGPGMALDDGRVQADFAANVVNGRDIVLNSDGTAVRTYTYVSDAIAGMFTALLRGTETAYNVADPAGLVSIRRLAELFTHVRPELGLKLIFTNEADSRVFHPVKAQGLDSARLAALGWKAEVSLPSGLERMVTALSAGLRNTRRRRG
ncbi:NAD-dependent epimerase/dehydratase family protein [Microbacterium resistens]|uniref:NAD-dependent epimerase/dehydratase family protein n=1 Tax=Microbacterium resistens TaxID=156977 RepID=UPI001C55EBD4|nr:NAD-dependent epimerase/dehydratase family protein [Microbacterium resistens]MBW1640526.1 NAD-dependent epimerase/dehydratase family protein [Microbacterium resistens]